MPHRTILISSVLTGLILSIPAFGADYKYDNQFCFVGTATHVIDHADGYKSGNFDVTGIRMGPEGDPFRAMAQHCVGQFTIINNEQEDNMRCEAANAAGDKVFGMFTRKFDPRKPMAEQPEASVRILRGTGKFAGITGGEGHSKMTDVISHTPTQISGCAHSWGTFTTK
jgi:hypothetical protein